MDNKSLLAPPYRLKVGDANSERARMNYFAGSDDTGPWIILRAIIEIRLLLCRHDQMLDKYADVPRFQGAHIPPGNLVNQQHFTGRAIGAMRHFEILHGHRSAIIGRASTGPRCLSNDPS